VKRLIAVIAALGLLFSLSSMALANTEECPDHQGHPNKVEATFDGELDDVVLPAGTIFCLKAGTEAFEGVADGTTSLVEYAKAAGIVGGDGEGRNISYYVTYGMATSAPTPTPEVTPTPTPDVTPTPTPDVTPTPTPDVDVTPTPTDEAAPTPTPTPLGVGAITEPLLPDTAMATITPAAILALLMLSSLSALVFVRLRR
jgi:hypothetical protein